ncbi:MAG: hypothetical protein ACJ77A_19375 [Actinomycetota bacterium]
MELNEAANRILRRHLRLIVSLLLLGVGGAYLLDAHDHVEYQAAARFVLDTQDPQSSTESQAIADTARAIATGPAAVAQALHKIGANRNPVELAKHHIGVEALGSSGVLELDVMDPNPRVAAALANALANRIIESRLAISTGGATRVLDELGSQIDALTHQIAGADTKLDSLNQQIAHTTDPQTLLGLRAERDDLSQTRTFEAQRRTVLESERATIATSDALRPQASMLDSAVPPVTPAPSRRAVDMALGGLLGLLLGIGVAATIEAFRPTVIGSVAVARDAGAPLLGELPAAPSGVTSEELGEVDSHLLLAAKAARVQHVELICADASMELFVMAWDLGAGRPSPQPVTGGEGSNGDPHSNGQSGRGGGPDAMETAIGVHPDSAARVGLVLVTPRTVRRARIAAAENFRQLSGWPLLGVITYRKRRRLFRRKRRAPRTGAHARIGTREAELEEQIS